eukprot:12223139-Alexandrium_andersonii.AAC.1
MLSGPPPADDLHPAAEVEAPAAEVLPRLCSAPPAGPLPRARLGSPGGHWAADPRGPPWA